MAIEILPHSEQYADAVHAFNLRMRAGGSHWGFYPDPLPEWIPRRNSRQPVWREYHLAIEAGAVVRGAYALKPQPWTIAGDLCTVADWQGPFSEGAIDPKYSMVALRLMRAMLKAYPLLYSWGHGSEEQTLLTMLEKMGWLLHATPLCVRVLNGRRFLRRNGYLRTTWQRRLAQDALALSGLGGVGFSAAHRALRLRSPRAHRVETAPVARFGSWADELWHEHKDRYAALAVRDADNMNTLVPEKGWPPATRLQMTHGGCVIGWALVLDTQMIDDKRFGTMRVGSVIDCFADPAEARRVVAGATEYLADRGVDIVISNQAHPGWARGFRDNGYLLMPGRRVFAASPELRARLEPLAERTRGLHLTNMDGHGPHGL